MGVPAWFTAGSHRAKPSTLSKTRPRPDRTTRYLGKNLARRLLKGTDSHIKLPERFDRGKGAGQEKGGASLARDQRRPWVTVG